jgi:demethylmenaquinone methyltransferase/2-methoxy-6-polyprenyl-1,4-benzoquinol methylase
MPTPETIKPYDGERPKVEEMFNSIATAYDFMNRAMTLGIDKLWRARAVKMVKKQNPQKLLDVATGTGDLAISLARKLPGAAITGIDLSEKMLAIGARRWRKQDWPAGLPSQRPTALRSPSPTESLTA